MVTPIVHHQVEFVDCSPRIFVLIVRRQVRQHSLPPSFWLRQVLRNKHLYVSQIIIADIRLEQIATAPPAAMTSPGAEAAFAEQTFDGLTWPDYMVIVLYFVFVLAVGLFVSPASRIRRQLDSE